MRKILLSFILIILTIILMGCGWFNNDTQYYSEYNQPTEISDLGKAPEGKNRVFFFEGHNYVGHKDYSFGEQLGLITYNNDYEYQEFSGWYDEGGNLYSPYTKIYNSVILYSSYDVDYIELVNIISTEAINGSVKIYSNFYNDSFFGIFSSDETQVFGSGFIFHEEYGRYYIITNNHVIYNKFDLEKSSYIVEDYLGNLYEAILLEDCYSADYDLAVLSIVSFENLNVLPLASKNPVFSDLIISLGQPNGQKNTITMGNLLQYGKIALSDTSIDEVNVQFDVVFHDAPISTGSSGGPILDTSFNIIGVNYAANIEENYLKFLDWVKSITIEIGL